MSVAASRWPHYGPQAYKLGIGSMMSFVLSVDSTQVDYLGSLELYCAQPGRFTQRSEQIGRLLAAHASTALVAAHHGADLVIALGSRKLIGEAVGVLMADGVLTEQQALEKIVDIASRNNIAVRDLAESITRQGRLPHALTRGGR
jgi:hypothetical protein